MTMVGANVVIGTAGHIDHGKTSLVGALTGVDLDAHPEEKERGITISLGFTPLSLPDGSRAAFVDVPGHERLVRTMVAGATGIDAVMFCVSAVDGVMPQTREHLSILGLLGVQQGVVVLTKSDLVDEELLELAMEDVHDLVSQTFLAAAPVVAVSSHKGTGLEELLEILASFERMSREATDVFRLPVDRSFTQPGFGTVVTGTVWSGTVSDGETVTILPSGQTTRVRGIQVHGEAAKTAESGWRTALNLAGIDTAHASRGVTVVTGPVPLSSMVDVRYTHLDSAPELDDGDPVRFLLGTAECLGRIYFADDVDVLKSGVTTWAQIRLETPIPCLPIDRFIIRRVSPMDTLGGGVIVDPWAKKMKRKDRLSCGEEIRRLYDGERQVWLERAEEVGLSVKEWAHRRQDCTRGIQLANRWFASSVVGRLEGALLQALQGFHETTPLSLGAHRRELRRGRLGHLPDKVFDALVDRLDGIKAIVIEGPLVRMVAFEVQLTSEQVALRQRLLATLTQAGAEGQSKKAIHERHKDPEVSALLHLLEKEGLIVDVPNLGWVHQSILDDLKETVVQWFSSHEQLTPGDFKGLTELSRRGAIPLMEWFDAQGLTRREGAGRVLGSGFQR